MTVQKKSMTGARKDKRSAGRKGASGSKAEAAKNIGKPTSVMNLKPAAGPTPTESLSIPYTKIEVSYKP